MTFEGNAVRCDGPGCSARVPMKVDPPLNEQQKVQLASFAQGQEWLIQGEQHYCPQCRDEANRPKLGF